MLYAKVKCTHFTTIILYILANLFFWRIVKPFVFGIKQNLFLLSLNSFFYYKNCKSSILGLFLRDLYLSCLLTIKCYKNPIMRCVINQNHTNIYWLKINYAIVWMYILSLIASSLQLYIIRTVAMWWFT